MTGGHHILEEVALYAPPDKYTAMRGERPIPWHMVVQPHNTTFADVPEAQL